MYDLYGQDRANKTALLLVNERYNIRFAPFVRTSKTRLAFIQADLDDMIVDVIEETGADLEYVKSRFEQFVADAVLDTPNNANHEELDYKSQDEGLPPAKDEEGDPLGEEVKKDDPLNRGEVEGAGAEEAREPDATVDLADSSADSGDGEVDSGLPPNRSKVVAGVEDCARCGNKLNPVLAKHTPVCPNCTSELRRLALADEPGYDNRDTNDQSLDYLDQGLPGLDQSLMHRCTICGKEGSRDEVVAHVQHDHQDALQAKQEELMGQEAVPFQQAAKTADSVDVPDASEPDRAEVQPLPSSPADRFDDTIQDLANRAAARQFSTPTDEQIHSLSSQLGLDEMAVRQSLVATATFGDHTGVNGELAEREPMPQGYQEVSLDGNNQVNAHEALVPVDLVVNKVADAMNMEPNLVYQQVRDKYGDDLPDKYHASVNGEIHYYLPGDMAQASQPQPVDQNVGPAAPPAPALPQQQPVQQQTY